jgi:hypothetical protein
MVGASSLSTTPRIRKRNLVKVSGVCFSTGPAGRFAAVTLLNLFSEYQYTLGNYIYKNTINKIYIMAQMSPFNTLLQVCPKQCTYYSFQLIVEITISSRALES